MQTFASQTRMTVYTIGHSTHRLDEFVELLRAHRIERLVDIRTIPRSRHNPQFNRDTLGEYSPQPAHRYRHLKELGGLRHARADSPNTGWYNASFRGFADYMQTPSLLRHWSGSSNWRSKSSPSSCALKQSHGAAIARSSVMLLSSAVSMS